MIRFIENIGDYYSQHFFDDGFPKKVFDKAGYVTQKKDGDNNNVLNHLTDINALVTPLREKYFRFKNDLLNIQRPKDKVKRTHDFHTEVLKTLGYPTDKPGYEFPVHLDGDEVIPVRYRFNKGEKPYLFIMEMKAIVHEADKEPEGIYEQTWLKEEWEKIFPIGLQEMQLKPDVIKEALSEMFLLPEGDRPVYVIMMAGAKIFLIHYEKWKYDSYLLFDLEELFTETQIATNKDYLSLFYALLARENFLGTTDSLLNSLDEDAHKAAYGVTQNLKKAVIYALENIANEAIWYKLKQAKTTEERDAIEILMASETFASELKDECLSMVYRLLFLFYAEAREDLEILPVKDATYQKGYSLEMLRDLEFVHLGTASKDGYFFSISLWKLFDYLHKGVKTANGFEMKPLDSPLFDNAELTHLSGVQFRNVVLQQIIKRLSLSEQSRTSRRGRISYGNLGINQLGSVYESLLAFSGFFAAEKLIEVKAADDPDGKDGTYIVPLSRRDDFKEEEILKDPENRELDKEIPKGYFVYRLNGRDRKKSASYYTPEVLTQTTVKYTLKGILDRLKERQEKGEDCAEEILGLKILEPAMGAAAFQNEVINQLANAYLELKEAEEVKKGRKRIVAGEYNDELQKVKAYIAANNVYGVDLNPTAVELGKLSLWLNCMHKNMETPFFAHRLGVGNAVVGCWLKVYNESEVIVEYPANGTTVQRSTPISKAWWAKAPQRVTWNSKDVLNRKPNQFYHFLLPDENMLASFGIGLIKEGLTDAQKKAVTTWKKEIKQPLTKAECSRLEKLCKVIDTLLVEHYKQIKGIVRDTTSVYAVYGRQAQQIIIKGYDEKERLAESRNVRSAPYYKLRMVMDYWCSLWFWDARKIDELPKRNEWYNEVEKILGINLTEISETANANDIVNNLKKHAADTSTLFASSSRLSIVGDLRNQHRFFHNELEFVEVFKEKGGFDVIVGNPPWIKILFEEKDIIAEQFPEVLIKKTTAPEVNKLQNTFLGDKGNMKIFLEEAMSIEASAQFMNSVQNYPTLIGQQTNLYKCIIANSFFLTAITGYLGLIHPEGIYDDPKGKEFRKNIYPRLEYHFQFKNSLFLFSEIRDQKTYSINIYRGVNDKVLFSSINNLLHPSTIDQSFNSNSKSSCPTLKIYDKARNKFIWDLSGHPDRIIKFSQKELLLVANLFENSSEWKTTKLPTLHSTNILDTFDKLSAFPERVDDHITNITEGWHETIDVMKGKIVRRTGFPSDDNSEMVYSGPHLFTATSFYKTPRTVCTEKGHYDVINLSEIGENFSPRSNYKVTDEKYLDEFLDRVNGFTEHDYRIAFRKMLNHTADRTLNCGIIAPKSTHINGVISIQLQTHDELLQLFALCSSIWLDFFVKATGSSNLTDNKVRYFPLGVHEKYLNQLYVRGLLLTCLTSNYKELWETNFNSSFQLDCWSTSDKRLFDFKTLSRDWSSQFGLKNSFSRRWAMVELDVIVGMALGMKLDDLIIIYSLQFPKWNENEEDTYYDQQGQMIFTASQGLSGVGLDRPVWDNIIQEVSPFRKLLKEGSEYTHTITKSELYKGQQVTYYSPFDKCDRVEDYKTAWAHFKKIFDEENTKEVTTIDEP